MSYGYGYRPLTRSSAGCFGFIFMLIMVGLGVVSILTVTGQRRLFADLEQKGLRAQGVVVDHDSSSGRHFFLDVRYDPAPKLKSFDVTSNAFFSLRDGDPVTVRYLAGEPYQAKLEGVEMATYPAGYIAVGAGLIVAGIGIFAGLSMYGRSLPPVDDF